MLRGLTPEELDTRTVDRVDIAYDEVPPKHYKENEDPKFFKSKKTGRGPLVDGWMLSHEPIMCSYKHVKIAFEVWGVQTRVEDYAHKAIRDILLLGHRQAFAWIDDWHGMTEEDVREFEMKMQEETNKKVLSAPAPVVENAEEAEEVTEENPEEEEKEEKVTTPPATTGAGDQGPAVEGGMAAGIRSWFSWS